MLKVHHLGRSQSDRIVWLCEELALPYELICYEREKSGSAPPDYKALHPFGTAPVISDGDLVLGESAAIVEYIVRRYAGGRLFPGPEEAEFADFLYWFHFANGSLVPALMVDYVSRTSGAPADMTPHRPSRSERAWPIIEARLGQAPYFAGATFTAADIMMNLARFAPADGAAYPHMEAYRKRMSERPAWQRAMAKAEPALARQP